MPLLLDLVTVYFKINLFFYKMERVSGGRESTTHPCVTDNANRLLVNSMLVSVRITTEIINAGKQSLWKVLFSQMSVCPIEAGR